MFNKLVFYMEACESGSMFEGVLPTNQSIYVTTAANAKESSWGTYCPPDDVVNGTELQSCLGDLYSVNWMENADSVGMSETLEDQYTAVKAATTESHVMQYGDQTYTTDPIGDFMGQPNSTLSTSRRHGAAARVDWIAHSRAVINGHKPSIMSADADSDLEAAKKRPGTVNSRDIPMHLAYYRYLRAEKKDVATAHDFANKLKQRIQERLDADNFFMGLAAMAGANSDSVLHEPSATPVICGDCCETSIQAYADTCGFNDYSLQYTRTFVNICNYKADMKQTVLNYVYSACGQN